MNRIKAFYNRIFYMKNRHLLLFEIIYVTLCSILLVPLLKYLFGCVINTWEHSYITEKNILSLIKLPSTILFILFVLIILFLLITFNVITILNLCLNNVTNRPIQRIRFGFKNSLHLISKHKANLMVHTFLMAFMTNLFYIAGILFHMDIPGYLLAGKSDGLFIKGILLVLLFVIAILAYQRLFTLFCLFHGKSSNLKMNSDPKHYLKDHKYYFLITFIVVNLVLSFLVYILYFITIKLTILLVYLNTDYFFTMTEFIYRFPLVNNAFRIIMPILSFAINLNLMCTFSQRVCMDQEERITFPRQSTNRKYFPSLHQVMKYKYSQIYVTTALGILLLLFIGNHSTFYQVSIMEKTKVTSHRGYSQVAPENTIPAIMKAMEARVDYIEIDIQQSKDGKLILLHDKSLKRTTGLDKKIWTVNSKKLSKLDAGSWFSKEYKNTHIPTLEEVFKLCKGKAKLNLEIKTHGKEDNLEEHLIELIHKYNYESQCFISSLNYDTLKKVKELNRNIKTNFVITTEPDGNYQLPYVDSLSYRSHYITRKVVEDIHLSGKEVHAWTVNDIVEINRLKMIGVDCITTDDPVLTQHVLYADVLNNYFYPNFWRIQSIPVINKIKDYN